MSAVLESTREVDGQRAEKPASAYAGWIAGELTASLNKYLRESQIGKAHQKMMFILDEERNRPRRPDVAFISASKWPVGQPPPQAGGWKLVPDLAVDVLIPANRYQQVLARLEEYFHSGVREVWLVIPGRFVQMFTSMDDLRNVRPGESLSTPLVPGWSMPLDILLPHEAVSLLDEDE